MNISPVKCAISITYSAVNDEIIVTGGSNGSEVTMWDIWNASNVNGWGKVHNNNETNIQYQVDCKLRIGNSGIDTWFASENEQIVFTKNVAQTLWVFGWYYTAKSHVRFGDLDENGRACNGSHIIFLDYSGAKTFRIYNSEFELYDSTISMVGDSSGNDPIIFEVGISDGGFLRIFDSRIKYAETQRFSIGIEDVLINGLEIYNATFLVNKKPLYEWNDITIKGNPNLNVALLAQFADPLTIRGLTFTHDSGNYTITLYGINPNFAHLELINPVWNFSEVEFTAPNNDEEAKIQWTIDLLITYPNGTGINGTSTGTHVLIQHFGVGGGIDYNATLNEDGTINQTILTMGLYNSTGGITMYNYNPFNIQVTNTTGFQDVNMNFTLGKQEDLTFSLNVSTGGYAGFSFLFLGLIIGAVVGSLILIPKMR